jgi:hypothetical protein
MYCRERSAADRAVGSSKSSSEGTEALSGTPWPGLVPQVTNGESDVASISTTMSNTASSSVLRVCQYSTALAHSASSGALGRPFRYANVVSSGAIMPARAPADAEGECAEHAVVEVWESPQNHRRARLGQAS